MTKPLALRLLAPTFAVCTLPSDAALPDIEAEFFSITRTADELSLVVPEAISRAARSLNRVGAGFRSRARSPST